MVTDQPLSFTIVLVDIKKAAEPFNGQIECVKKNMYDPNLKYVAISYRWGEVNEQVIQTTSDADGYLAHITSFALTDFYELCQYMMEEEDLKQIDYVWIDAISVDQQNKQRRKSTIREMTRIYQHATYILAVPDLHLSYLNFNSANQASIEIVRKHAVYIYHLIATHCQDSVCDDIERIWGYNLLCDRSLDPSHYLLFFRHQLLSKLRQVSSYVDGYHLLEPILNSSVSVSKHARHHVERYWYLNQTLNKSSLVDLHHLEQKYHNPEHHPLHPYHSSDHPGHTHRPRQLDLRWLQHPWRSTLLTHIVPQWNQIYHQTTRELDQAFQFLHYLMNDWSNRAWVISEYHIAKKKHALKFTFLLLRSPFATSQVQFLNVFASSFCFPQEPPSGSLSSWRILGQDFTRALAQRLGERDYIDMIIGSRASRNEDRFHAILPLWPKYNNLILDSNTITSWSISDVISVRLQMYALMNDPQDKVRLLHACAQYSTPRQDGSKLLLPSFATSFKPAYLSLIEQPHGKNNISALDFNRCKKRLELCAHMYYRKRESDQQDGEDYFGAFYRICDWDLPPLAFKQGSLVAILVPLFYTHDKDNEHSTASGALDGSRLHLIGDEQMNHWVVVGFFGHVFYHWRDFFTGPYYNPSPFHIY